MDLEKEINDIINANKLVKINDKVYLTNYQIDVLNRYEININVNSINEILFEIDEILECSDEPQLEEVANSLQEYLYYNETNK